MTDRDDTDRGDADRSGGAGPPTSRTGRLRVMQSFSRIRPNTNPYLVQLVSATSAGVEMVTFSWVSALRGNFDVLHIHWPEVMLRGPGRVSTWSRRAAFAVLLLRTRLGHRGLVRTMHNLRPHEEGPRIERWLIEVCERWTTVWIRLNEGERPPSSAPVVTIPHGDYRQWYAAYPVPPSRAGVLLYFGLVRAYKGVDRLIGVFKDCPDPALRLRVVGKAEPGPLRDLIVAAQLADERIAAELRFLSDEEVAGEVGRAQLVVLPYRDMFNSGTLLLALSIGRPVLVPSNRVTEALADEVGPQWIIRYAGELSCEAIRDAVDRTKSTTAGDQPDLSRRGWDLIGAQHVTAYYRAADVARNRVNFM